MSIWEKRYNEMILICVVEFKELEAARKRVAELESTMEPPVVKIRPDSEGWWWKWEMYKGGPEVTMGRAKIVPFCDDEETEKVLAWSVGGCWMRCDKINAPRDLGSRWIKAIPPVFNAENSSITGATASGASQSSNRPAP
jgi:hypothetical protein